ncbi:IPT/TIG domain-containing protein [Niabella sp. CC-SYL272]|uniref:IPT/TIG domain-containing protein n=1 Tax=Niabella agricola TaxID=2891571 RepID=UPI001F343079|nr:IPT/TIG domain-containing protein [Niabella agricola]MCF3110234.1 IPT/TIG domain-containing protein [Niabella agricola]
MNQLKVSIYTISFFVLLCCSSCKKQTFRQVDDRYVHNNALPVSLERFAPLEGSEATEVMLYGDNFSSDVQDIRVTINGRETEVLGANQKRIIIKIPQGAGTGKLTLTIGGKTVSSEAAFTYTLKRTVTTIAGSSAAATFDFKVNAGMDIDSKGNLYLADIFNNCIRKVAPDGTVSTFAGVPGTEGNKNGAAAQALFNHPADLVVDQNDNVYVADTWNWAIRKIATTGEVTTVLGWVVPFPQGITISKKTGTLYVVSALPAASQGKLFEIAAAGVMTERPLSAPIVSGGITMDHNDNLVIADNGRSVVYRVNTQTWNMEKLAGLEDTPGWVDGVAGNARFEHPWDVAVDSKNNIYVAGCGHLFNSANIAAGASNIRMIEAGTNKVSTVAGSNSMGYKDGLGGEARFNVPTGLAIDAQDNVYILDRDNLKIRKMVSQ